MGGEGGVFEVEGSTIPNSWAAAAEALTQLKQGKIIVIGPSDVGKSAFCTYLANSLMKERLRVRILDGDIGQADIGPPTAIGSAIPTSPIYSLTDLNPEALLFVGDTTPSRVEAKLIEGIHRLGAISQEELTIINTDGWVLDPQAVLYKMKLVEAIEPDLVIGISASDDLQPILSGSRAKCFQVRPPEQVLPRTRSDRRDLRTLQYRKFLDGGTIKTMSTPRRDPQRPSGANFTPKLQVQRTCGTDYRTLGSKWIHASDRRHNELGARILEGLHKVNREGK